MRFFSLPNLSSNDIEEIDPRTVAPIPSFESKDKFREWCNEISTRHCFFNHTEGLVGKMRINSTDNTPFYLYGFTGDYDAEQTQAEALAIVKKNAPDGLLPGWISTSFSGHIRLTWEFSEPVLVDQPELAERMMKLFAAEFQLDKLCAGFDTASLKLGQYYEAGREWTELPEAKPINSRLLGTLFYRAAKATTIKIDGPTIPIEAVAAEIEKRWPGRVDNFAVGSRVPLFWIDPFEPRVGAQVGDHGMLCYSTRAGRSFVPWGDKELLGPAFVREYEASRIGAAAEGLFFDGKHYWRQDDSDYWRARNKEDTIMWLKGQGINPRPDAKNFAAETDRVLLAVQEMHEVKAAAAVVHDSRQLVIINGEKYLNIATAKLVQPSENGDPSNFPWLREFFDKIWAEPVESQRDFFLAWLQHAYRTALAGRPAPGQAIIIAGPPSSGKTFLNHHILGRVFGGWSDATEFLMNRTNFNKQDSEVYLWAIDDTKGATSWENKAAFSAALKKHVANPQVRCEAKGKDAIQIPWKGRIVVTCNTDKESLEIIPSLHLTIKDKLCLFLWNGWKAPFLPNGGSEEVVACELPFFLKWLLDWTPPPAVLSDNPRYAVGSYHHPEMEHTARDASAAARLEELLDLWKQDSAEVGDAQRKNEKIWASPTRLRKYLSEEPSMRDALREFSRQRMAQALEELGLKKRASGTQTEYLIFQPAKT